LSQPHELISSSYSYLGKQFFYSGPSTFSEVLIFSQPRKGLAQVTIEIMEYQKDHTFMAPLAWGNIPVSDGSLKS